MTNHPNRSRRVFGLLPTESPTPAQVRELRAVLDHTQEQAAAFVRSSTRTWQAWEGGQNPMPLAMWELWHLKVGRPVRQANPSAPRTRPPGAPPSRD